MGDALAGNNKRQAGEAGEDAGALLELRGVGKFYGEKPVLKKISLTLEAGRSLMIVGVNGAGKSTLLSLMAGLSRPSFGEIRRRAEPGEIGYLGHKTFLYPRLTAMENLLFWAKMTGSGLGAGDCREALERVGLSRSADERAGAFSRGMSQRLNLARVFLQSPRVLLLDEPGSGLDVRSAAALREEMASARKRGAAVAFVSHDLAADLPLADSVLYLDKARSSYYGPAGAFDPAVLSGACVC